MSVECICDHCGKRQAAVLYKGSWTTPDGWNPYACHSRDPELRIRQLCSRQCQDAVYGAFNEQRPPGIPT